jgi:hypothetical protein
MMPGRWSATECACTGTPAGTSPLPEAQEPRRLWTWLLPELANRRVLKRLDGPLDDTVPAERPISVRDLLTLRMGVGYISASSSAYPVQKAANEQQVLLGPPKPQTLGVEGTAPDAAGSAGLRER